VTKQYEENVQAQQGGCWKGLSGYCRHKWPNMSYTESSNLSKEYHVQESGKDNWNILVIW